MSVKFNDDLNHTIIVEDVLSDEEENNNNFENNFDQEEFNLVKNDNVQNNIQKLNVHYKPMPPYYKQQPVRRQPQKNQISYDDILKSMNMCVKDGKLEMIQPVHQENTYSPQVSHHNNGQQNSYIYNKYFKKYANQTYESQQIPSRPLTQQERRALMIKRQIEIAEQRKRISEIKSTKLQFSDNNVNISSVHRHKDLNRLFKMKF